MKDDKTEERKAFSFLRSYYKTLQELPDDKRLRMFDAIAAFAFDGCEPSNLEDWIEAAIWQGMKGTLEDNNKMHMNVREEKASASNDIPVKAYMMTRRAGEWFPILPLHPYPSNSFRYRVAIRRVK